LKTCYVLKKRFKNHCSVGGQSFAPLASGGWGPASDLVLLFSYIVVTWNS